MKIYSKIVLSLLLTYIPSICAMEQTQANYIPPVNIGNILNATNYKLELKMKNEDIATLAPNSSEYIHIELPLKQDVLGFITPWINVQQNTTILLDWRFERFVTHDNAYIAYVHWRTGAKERPIVRKETSFTPGQKDSYVIDITFDGQDLGKTHFDIECTLK